MDAANEQTLDIPETENNFGLHMHVDEYGDVRVIYRASLTTVETCLDAQYLRTIGEWLLARAAAAEAAT